MRGFFDVLVRCQLARITHNKLSLHYSTDNCGLLDPDALFDKMVARHRGGYCFELRVFFQHIMHSVGFSTTAVGCRMRNQRPTSEGLDIWRTMEFYITSFPNATDYSLCGGTHES